jgi:hypothetical protein
MIARGVLMAFKLLSQFARQSAQIVANLIPQATTEVVTATGNMLANGAIA